MILGYHQGGRGGVWATYAPPGGIVGVHRSPWLQGEPRFTWRTEGVYKTPPHRFFQISQSPFLFPVLSYRWEEGIETKSQVRHHAD